MLKSFFASYNLQNPAMTFSADNLSPLFSIAPQIIILIAILLIMITKIVGLKNHSTPCHIALAFLAIALFLLVTEPSFYTNINLFYFSISNNIFTYFCQILAILSAICTLLLLSSYEKPTVELTILFLSALLGSTFMIIGNDFIIIYLGLELTSLSLYLAVASKKSAISSIESTMKYFILSSAVSAIFLFGMGLVYMSAGSLNLVSLFSLNSLLNPGFSNSLANIMTMPMSFWLGSIMMIIGVFFKLSAAPFHLWAPDVYQDAPVPVVTFIATVSKIAAFSLLFRIIFDLLKVDLNSIQKIILLVVLFSMIIGSLGGIKQENVMRMMSYSAISHMGFIMAAIFADNGINHIGLTSSLNYLIIYTILTAIPTFTILSTLDHKPITLKSISGLSSKSPFVAVGLAFAMFSLIGIPPFSGFFAKFYVIDALLQKKEYLISIFLILTSVISSYYYLRVVKYMFFGDVTKCTIKQVRINFQIVTIALIFLALNVIYVVFGVNRLFTFCYYAVKDFYL